MTDVHVGTGGIAIGGDNNGTASTHVVMSDDARLDYTLMATQVGAVLEAAKVSPAATFAPEKIEQLEQIKLAADRNSPTALSLLKGTGQWLLQFGTAVGEQVAVQALKGMMGQ